MDKVKSKEEIVRDLCDGWVGGMTHGDEQRIVYPAMETYATQQSRIDAIRFLEWKTTNGWEYHINDVNEWLWYKEDKILTTDELYLLSINKK